jgi:hypothetical protein
VSAFELVLLAVVGVGVVAAVALLMTTARTWKDYGRSHLTMERDAPATSPGTAAADREREQEIRQLLQARNELRRRRGRETVDIEQELRRLTGTHIDAGLRDEIRQLVIARNHRRQRVGKPPLDVESEVERKIAELSE